MCVNLIEALKYKKKKIVTECKENYAIQKYTVIFEQFLQLIKDRTKQK